MRSFVIDLISKWRKWQTSSDYKCDLQSCITVLCGLCGNVKLAGHLLLGYRYDNFVYKINTFSLPNTKSDNLFVKEIKNWNGEEGKTNKQKTKTNEKTPQGHLRVYQMILKNNRMKTQQYRKHHCLEGETKAYTKT